jgi:hypothetical protein
MAAAIDPSHVPPRPWHTIGLDFLTHLPISAGFESELAVVDHLTRMVHLFPCTKGITFNESAKVFLHFTWPFACVS